MTDQLVRFDKDGFLIDLSSWNRQLSLELAQSCHIDLSDEHWEIIRILREFYASTDVSPSMRPFVKLVRDQCGAQKGNSINLMRLFGSSPAKTAAKIAGLPKPTNCL
jgi:tRNA 2-thiouridine synthesizing protein E